MVIGSPVRVRIIEVREKCARGHKVGNRIVPAEPDHPAIRRLLLLGK